MKHVRRITVVAGILALLPAVAAAQTFPTVPSNTVIGRTAVGTGPAQAIPFATLFSSALFDATLGSTRGMIPYRGVGGWTGLPPGAAGSLLQSGGAGADPSWLALPLSVAKGGTGQITAPAARGSSGLNIEALTSRGDAIYTILSTDRTVGTTATFTASRTWTLPAANSVNAGQEITVADYFGGVSSVNTLVIARSGSDTINGATSVTINRAFDGFRLRSDGTSKWSADTVSANTNVSLTTASNALVADVTMSNTSTYFDGPSMAQGATGVWYASGNVTLVTNGSQSDRVSCKLWDGTNSAVDSTSVLVGIGSTTATGGVNVALHGIISAPAGNIRISCVDHTATTGKMLFNISGQSKDSAIFGFRIQ